MGKVFAFVRAARIHHYVKNGFVWLPMIFGHKLMDLSAVGRTFWAFVCFSLTASAIYVMNDIRDRHEDRLHPSKRLRPIASGDISLNEARVFSVLLFASGGILAYLLLPLPFLGVVFTYIGLNIAYSIHLKSLAIMDVVCIASGFVLRIFAGGIAADVTISHWIVIMTFLMALFLGLTKRRDDLMTQAGSEDWKRTSLSGYSLEFISLGVTVLSAVIIVAYILYTVSPEIIQIHRTRNLYLSSGWVVIGILRYLQRVYVYHENGSPVTLLYKDRILQWIVLGWMGHIVAILYGGRLWTQ